MTSEMVPCIPYKGSKRKLARRLISYMPSANTFYDLFAGGGAMTSAAILSGKYKNIVMNDIAKGLTKLYCDVLAGEYNNRYQWVSRDDFMNRSTDDAFTSVMWSFGNNCRCYIYGREIEQQKKSLHYALVYDDYSMAEELFSGIKDIMRDLIGVEFSRDKYLEFIRRFRKHYVKSDDGFRGVESLERLQNIERLADIKQLSSIANTPTIERFQLSYDQVDITDDDCIVYCDIPYIGTDGYDGKSSTKSTMDYDKFYDWVRNSKHLVFVSEYRMPDDFVTVSFHDHTSSLSATATNKVEEKLFVHKSKRHLVNFIKPKQQELLFL